MTALFKFFAGLCAVILLGVVAIVWSGAPGSAADAQARLSAEAARLTASAGEWARFEIDGQSVRLSGEAPSIAARDALIAAFKDRSGVLGGPFLNARADAITVAAIAPERLPPVVSYAEEATPVEQAQSAPEAPSEAVDPVEALIASVTNENTGEAATPPLPDPAPETPTENPGAPVIDVASPPAATETADAAPAPAREIADDPDEALAPIDAACIDGVLAAAANIQISFASNRSALDDNARASLVPLATLLADCPAARLTVVGHTDSSGSAAENIELSRDRARAVADQLKSLGADPARIGARGVGSAAPIANNATPDGRRRNRRIEFDLARDNE